MSGPESRKNGDAGTAAVRPVTRNSLASRCVTVLVIMAVGMPVQLTFAQRVRSTARNNVNTNRNVHASGNTNLNRNVNVNKNVNVNRNFNVNNNVEVHGGYYGGCCYHEYHPVAAVAAVAVTAAVVGSIVASIPPSCTSVMVNGFAYRQCGSTWYQPQISGSSTTYVVVNAPR